MSRRMIPGLESPDPVLEREVRTRLDEVEAALEKAVRADSDMYCGICVEVCPFDALFWSPEFEYSEYEIVELTHEKEKLEEWTYTVLPPPEQEVGAQPELQEVGAAAASAGGAARGGRTAGTTGCRGTTSASA